MATKRLIDANAIKYRTISYGGWGMPEEVADKYDIDKMPTVDAVEVVHGHNLKDYDSAFECSICGWEDWDTLTADTSKYNYCPNCGAKMDGDGNGN